MTRLPILLALLVVGCDSCRDGLLDGFRCPYAGQTIERNAEGQFICRCPRKDGPQ